MTESPIAVMSVPETSAAARPAGLAFAFPLLAVPIVAPVTVPASVARGGIAA